MYVLSRLQKPFSDAVGNLRLQVEETSFSKVSAISRALIEMGRERYVHISTNPSERRVPHALCLHVLCEFSDQQVLMMKRHQDAWYYPSAFAISFEEQLDKIDFRDGGEFAVSHLVKRAVCEELFPMLGKYHSSPLVAWAQVNDFIEFSRIWSIFIEEEIGNFSLFCHLRMAVDADSYVEVYRELKKQGDRRDREGRLYALRPEDVRKILKNEEVYVSEILVDEVEDSRMYGARIRVDKLHPTSRYRLLSWATANRMLR